MKRKALSILLAVCLIVGCLPMGASALRGGRQSGGTSIPKLSKEAITALLEENSLTLPSNLYDTVPSVKAPYATGKVKTEALQAAGNRLNALRQIAGLPAVTLDMGLCEEAQYGAVVLAANNRLSHFPNKPDDMDEAFYEKAAAATSSSNLASGYSLTGAVDGFMDDEDSGNIDRLGHRRWQLNPKMGKVGFGNSERYTVEKVFDRSGSGCDYDFIGWPASGYFPNSVFEGNIPWSITLNPADYATPKKEDLTVTLTRESDKKQWTFLGTKLYNTSSSAYFNVDTDNYGVSNCIIFRPDGVDKYDGVYTVEVMGLKTSDGAAVADFTYSVEFFSPEPAAVKVTGVQLNKTKITLQPGATDQLNATVLPTNATNKGLTWSTSDTSVATVSSNGTVTAVSEGAATITAKTNEGGYTARCSVTVTANENPYIATFKVNTYTAQISGDTITVTLPAGVDASYARIYIDVMRNGKVIDEGFDLYIDGTYYDSNSNYEITDFEDVPITLVCGDYWKEYRLTVKREGDDISFTDVPADAFYYNAVQWAVENGVTSGTGGGKFSPKASCTRAQAVTFLWRAAGEPKPVGDIAFTDVKSGSYYEKAVRWAVEKDITSGTGGGKFSPDATCDRSQIVTFLWRAAGEPEPVGDIAFTDVKSGSYYKKAVQWAVEKGITSGTGGGKFSPTARCDRSQIVTFLYRYYN